MSEWLESYKELEYRTRWLGIVGALVLTVIAAGDTFGTIQSIAVSEIGPRGMISLIGIEEILPAIIVALAVLRTLALTYKDGAYRSVGSISWLVILIMVLGFIIVQISDFTPDVPSDCVPVPDKVCFAIYDMRRASITPLASCGYVIFGIFRFAVLSLLAYLRWRPKFR